VEALPLASMVPGYDHNAAAARVILGWLKRRYQVEPAIGDAVGGLLERFVTDHGRSATGYRHVTVRDSAELRRLASGSDS
jgi:hypothetical protein